jgi:hypothetical protein
MILLGPEVSTALWNVTWPIFIIMAMLLISIVVFFLINYRLFTLLEREDWPALAYYLEQKIFGKNQYSSRNVQLLATSYLVLTDYPSVLQLENRALIAKPSAVEDNILIFGAARILSGNYREASVFFKTYFEKGRTKEEQWLRWFYGFSQMLARVFTQAELEFKSLAISSPNLLITGLSSYFLYNNLAKYSLKPAECRTTAENGKDRVKKSLVNQKGWKKEKKQIETEIHASIIMKYISEAETWLYKQDGELNEKHSEIKQT